MTRSDFTRTNNRGGLAPSFDPTRVLSMTRILLVEDDAAIRRALRRSLEDQGDAVAVAPDGMTGLRLVLSEQPDVVLLDLGLPDVDGLRMLGMLRGVSDVPVIVVTAQDDDRTVVKALDAGADDYVVKPFGTEQVQARIRAVLRLSLIHISEPTRPY